METRFNLIVCVNNKGVIGRNHDLLYHIRNDMQNFKRLTTNHVVIMGSTTFESLPVKPLKNRVNIVITRNVNKYKEIEGVIAVNSLEEAIKKSANYAEVFVIGGASIYNQFLDKGIINRVILTEVDDDSEEKNDAKILMPWKLKPNEWQLRFQTWYMPDENGIYFRYTVFDYKKEKR